MDRRKYIKSMALGSVVATAGCTLTPENNRQQDNDRQDPDQIIKDSTQADTAQPVGTPGATAEPNPSTVDVELPGTPVDIKNGELPIYQVQPVIDAQTSGLTEDVGDGSKDIDVGETTTQMMFSPIHEGQGVASGYATGTFRSAWTAPESGTYTLAAEYERSGAFKYDVPSNGNVMSSFDLNTQIIVYNETAPRILADKRFPIPLRSSPKISQRKVAEFLIETGVAAIVGYSLGLGLIARVVLSQIVSELIELEDSGDQGSAFDVETSIPNPNDTKLISARFTVTEGTTMVFEMSPMVSWSYNIHGTRMQPQFDTGFKMKSFTINYIR